MMTPNHATIAVPTREARLVRRIPTAWSGARLSYGQFRFELAKNALIVRERAAELTEKEYALVLLLFRNHDRTLSRS